MFPWHIERTIVPNERLASENKSRVGYFVLHQQRWFLVNESMPDLKNAKTGEAISIGGKVELEDGLQLLTGKSPSSRLFYLQMV